MNAGKTKVERIESRKIDRLNRFLLFCGVGSILITVSRFFPQSSIQITGKGWWLDIPLAMALPLYFLLRNQKKLSSREGQFIEWNLETIVFKLKNDSSAQTIQRDQIHSITIHLDIVEVLLYSNQKFILDISDFDNYKDRLKIKANFEKEKKSS